mmetsp:Transcript_12938/g.16793  ORF Transcript_12938/g.16793 Transcript_12938/m.16793 type:complete len:90 (+) Transcript_12938:230-499(+)
MTTFVDSVLFDLPNKQVIAVCATGLAGLLTGGLCFVSAVHTRSYLIHLDNERKDCRRNGQVCENKLSCMAAVWQVLHVSTNMHNYFYPC